MQGSPFAGLHLVPFEKRLSANTLRVQRAKLQKESPHTPDTNDQQALARALIGCRALWGLLGILFVGVSLAVQVTLGVWCLVPYAVVVACLGMNLWRGSQSKRLMKGIGIETSARRVIARQIGDRQSH